MRSRTPPRGETAREETRVEGDEAVQALVSALDDDRCRAILQFTADDYRTANEIADACDMPLSTTYRKLDLLTEAGLLAERTSIHRSGNHATEYTQQLDSLHVEITGDGGVEVTISYDESPDPPAVVVPS